MYVFVFAEGCERPWKNCTNICCLLFDNVQASWIAAYAFCLKQGGRLPNANELLTIGNNSTSYNPTPRRCWLAQRNVYTPRDPLEGWYWLDGSPLYVDRTWAFGELYYNGKRERCAAFVDHQTWADEPCHDSHTYICKVEKTGKQQDPDNKVNGTTDYFVSYTNHLYITCNFNETCYLTLVNIRKLKLDKASFLI